jgi:ADP-ribose pyrophosphatase
MVRHAGSAVMMAVDEKKRILLVRQYRLPAGQVSVGTAGRPVDPGETPLQAAAAS